MMYQYILFLGMMLNKISKNMNQKWVIYDECPTDHAYMTWYQLKNSSWMCIDDSLLIFDPDDSY